MTQDFEEQLNELNEQNKQLEQKFNDLTKLTEQQQKKLDALLNYKQDDRTPDQKIRDLADEIYSESNKTISYSEALNIAAQRAPKLFKTFADDYHNNF
jgi:ferritin-like metal-binding protein YciE